MSTNNPMSNIPPLGPPTGMMPGGAPSKFKPIDPMRVLRANWIWLVLAFVVGALIGGGTWYTLNRVSPKYTSIAQFDVRASNVDLATGRTTGPVRMSELEPLILREVQAILAEPTLRQILNNPSVQQTSWFSQFNNNFDNAVEDLSTNVLQASHIRDTPLFVTRAITGKGQDAQIILTALRDEFLRIKAVQVDSESERDLLAAQRRLNTAEERIAGIRGQITRFLANTPLETLTESTSEAALQVSRLVIEVTQLNKSFNTIQATYNQLSEREQAGNFDPSDEERELIESTSQIRDIDTQLRQLRVSKKALLDRFQPEHRSVRELEIQILAFEREREEEFDEQARLRFKAKLEQAALGVQIIKQELDSSDGSLAEWTIKRQEFVRLKQEYDTLVREQEQAEFERQLATKSIADLIEIDNTNARVVVEEAFPPQKAKKTFPPSPFVMVPGIAMLVTGIVTGLAFLRELMDQRVRSAADVKMIPDASLIGMIPDADEEQGMDEIERVVEKKPDGLLAEAFRQVRTTILSKIDRRGYKTLMLVSAKPGAGVSATIQNLGVSCSLSGRKVLIIDANFRRPNMAKLMGVQANPGLADVLSGDQPIEQVSSLIQTQSDSGLSLLPAGNTANAAVEMFESSRFHELIAQLESQFDLLIIDAPPALLTSDAQLLSRHVDAMVLVSRARSDTRGMLQRMYRELDGQRADILGFLLNGVQASAGGYLKRNFQEFHAYSGPDRRKADRSVTGRGIGTQSNGSTVSSSEAAAALIDQDQKLDASDSGFSEIEDEDSKG